MRKAGCYGFDDRTYYHCICGIRDLYIDTDSHDNKVVYTWRSSNET